jgi:probable rRNA maturation factor
VSLVTDTLHFERVRNAMVSVTFVGETAIARLNEKYLGHSGPTDVISFSFERSGSSSPVVGDIYVCPRVAAGNAKRLRIPLKRELARLVVHGSLHLAGLDHPEGARRTQSPMWQKQERIIDRHR